MHKHYIRYDENECVKCIQYYYNSLYVNKETLNHLIMQFVGLPLHVIRSRQSTRNLLDIPWIFKSWDDAFAYYRSKHFQEPNKDNPVTAFLKDAIEAYIVNKFDIKKRIYDKTNEFNLVTIEELIMTNKEHQININKDSRDYTYPGDFNKPQQNLCNVLTPKERCADTIQELENSGIGYDTKISHNVIKWFIRALLLKKAESTVEKRFFTAVFKKKYINKPFHKLMDDIIIGIFTFDTSRIRNEEEITDLINLFARIFKLRHTEHVNKTAEEFFNYIEHVEYTTALPQPVTSDTKEENTMSAKLTNVDVYQTITKAAKITEQSVRQLIAQLFIDAKGRVPTENIIDRFMQSVDVTAHEHWSGLVKFLLSEDYKPNLTRLPFGDETRQSMLKVLKAHEASGTFDFSGDESLFDLVADTKDVEKEPEPVDTDNVVGIEGVGLVETEDKPSEVKDDGDSLPVIIPNVELDESMWNQLRISIENIFKRYEFDGNLIYALTKDVVIMLENHTQVDGKLILPVIDDIKASYVPDDNCVIFNDVFALQLIALLLLVEHEKFTSIESKEYMHAILKYVSNVTTSLKSGSTDGKWFNKHHVSMHLSVFPDFAKTEGDLIRASYMIASSVVSPERANVILTMPAVPILTDLTLVPTEYMLIDTDTIKPDLVAIGIIQQMIILFTAEEKDVKIDKPETQFDIDVSKPLPVAEANFFDPKNAPNTGYAIQEDSNIKPQAESKYLSIVNDLFTLGIPENPLAAKHDEFLGEMATFLKELNVDLEIFEPPHTVTSNAFLAVELFMLYVIEHIRTKSSHIKPTIIGSFIYYMNIFIASNVFNNPVKVRSLINNGTFSSVKEINVNTVCTFVNRLMCTRFPFNDLLLKNKGIYLNAGQPINQAMNNLAEANQQNRPYDSLACVAYIALEVARQINVAMAAEPQPNPSTKGNTTMDNRESHFHSIENVVRDTIHTVTYMHKTPSFVARLTSLTMNLIHNSPFATTNDNALSNALPYIIKTALLVGLVNGDLKHGPTTARTISAIYRIPTLISFTNIDNYQYLFNKIKAIANLTIEEIMNLQRNVIFRDNLEVETLIERPAVSIVTLITLLLSQYSNTPAPQNTARFGFSSSDYAAQLQSQYNPQPINPAVNVPAGMDTGLRSFGQMPMYPAAYHQPVGTARPAQPVTFGQQAVWEQRPFDSMRGMYGNVQVQPSDNLLRDIQNLQAEIEALEQDDIILNNRLQTARTKMSRLIAKLK